VLPGLVSAAGVLAESLFAALFPSDCRLCGTPLINVSRLPVCPPCLSRVHAIEGNLCAVCGERIFNSPASPDLPQKCGVCRRTEAPFVRATAYGSYEGELRGLIHLLKYEGVLPARKVLGRFLAESILQLEDGFESGVVVIPVPLHKGKFRKRGFNQTEVAAKEALSVIRDNRFRLQTAILVRRRDTASQIGLTRHQRRENMRGAFQVNDKDGVKGREVLLVDDVFTTGTTVSECARVLVRAGASKVWVATIARTLRVDGQTPKTVNYEGPEGKRSTAAA